MNAKAGAASNLPQLDAEEILQGVLRWVEIESPSHNADAVNHMVDHVEYVATDHDLQDIPWVRYTNADGEVTVYRSDGKTTLEPPVGHVRKLDCIDCHNLTGHDIPSPQRAYCPAPVRRCCARRPCPSFPTGRSHGAWRR